MQNEMHHDLQNDVKFSSALSFPLNSPLAQRFYDGIDWSQSWYDSIRPQGLALIAAPDWRAHLNAFAKKQALHNHQAMPVCFIAQEDLPEGRAYEAHISATGQVPTRENLHDFFNALVWLTFPAIKCQLNALQSAQIALLGIGKSRGPARDAATIFDENAAILVLETVRRGGPCWKIYAIMNGMKACLKRLPCLVIRARHKSGALVTP